MVIDASTNLLNWVPILTNPVPAGGSVYFSDGGSAGLAARFYRARFQF